MSLKDASPLIPQGMCTDFVIVFTIDAKKEIVNCCEKVRLLL